MASNSPCTTRRAALATIGGSIAFGSVLSGSAAARAPRFTGETLELIGANRSRQGLVGYGYAYGAAASIEYTVHEGDSTDAPEVESTTVNMETVNYAGLTFAFPEGGSTNFDSSGGTFTIAADLLDAQGAVIESGSVTVDA